MRGYLIDAHALLWYRNGDERLPLGVRQFLGEESSQLYISDATLWELTIKHSIGKLTLRGGVESLYQEWIGQELAQSLPMEWAHIIQTGQLPLLHGDPFDRMLVAQALLEDLTLVTGDAQIQQYTGVKLFWE